MTVVVTELRDDFPGGPDPNFNPKIFSEDEEEHTTNVPKRLTNENITPIAPMSPKPSRFSMRNNRSNQTSRLVEKSTKPNLAKAESYEDEITSEHSEMIHQTSSHSRPKTIDPSLSSSPRPGPSYASLVTQYSRSSSNSSGQSRHAISPLCCEGSVPTLQSPKNAVAPSDIIFDRPPAAGQTTVMSYSTNSDYTNNVVQVKNALMTVDQPRINSHVNPVPLNLNLNFERVDVKVTAKEKPGSSKKKEILYIDEDTPTTSVPSICEESKLRRVPTAMSISPACLAETITRSCSVGYLDSMDIVPSDVALSMLRKDTPNKRLVLVDRKPINKKNKKMTDGMRKQKMQQCSKSKSLDSCDLLQDAPKNNCWTTNNNMDKLPEAVENESIPKIPDEYFVQHQPPPAGICPTCLQSIATDCFCKCFKKITKQQNSNADSQNNNIFELLSSSPVHQKKKTKTNKGTSDQIIIVESSNHPSCSKNNNNNNIKMDHDKILPYPPQPKKKSEVITSYTDSPLFSRKHRFGDDSSSSRRSGSDENRSPILGKKSENTFSFIKQLSEARRKRKEELAQKAAKADAHQQVEVTPVEPRASVSLHTQVSSTNCIY